MGFAYHVKMVGILVRRMLISEAQSSPMWPCTLLLEFRGSFPTVSKLLEAGEIKRLQKRRRRSLILLTTSVILTALGCALRFVPRLNDRISGRPEYAKAMARLTAEEIARAAQNSFPVIVLGQDDRCDPLRPTGVTQDDIAASLYVLTWSEREHFNCINACVLPVDVSKFANLLTIHPGEGWTAGPKLLRPVQVLPITRQVDVFPPQYLQLLHWRAKPRLPLTEDEGARLAPRSYTSASDPSVSPDAKAGLTLDFDQARALVREPHDRLNFRLSLLLGILSWVSLASAFALFLLYREASRYEWLSKPVLSTRAFLFQDLHLEETAARNRLWEQQQELARQRRHEESLRTQRQELEFRLRSALESLHDTDLRQRIEECLATNPTDVNRLGQLWEEVMKDSAYKAPEERLAALLESLKPYCTEEELASCREETLSILEKSGFRSARKYAVAMHEDFRLRAKAKELETLESQDDSFVE